MAQQFSSMSQKHQQFITAQKIFFVATAADTGRVNLSPKGMDSLRIINPNRVIWLNVTGSGNETAAHVQRNPRMTLMFNAFDGPPLILRLYGTARAVHQQDADWPTLFDLFEPIPGARQIFDLKIDLVQTSCGMAVPTYTYDGDREHLRRWAENKGEQGLQDYWVAKNQHSIDGFATDIVELNGIAT